MFRRREDEETDATGQASMPTGNESVKVLTPEASAYSPPQAAREPSPLSSTFPAAAAAARPSAEPVSNRVTAPAPTSSFRPSQPQPEMPRSRAPESKAVSNFAAGMSSGMDRNRESRRVLTVGSDILLKGEIATCDRLVIEGKVDAVLNDVGTVELAESGSFKGVAQVENAEISGLFEGELVVKGRLVIYASGRVRGKITYGEIEIERGGELTGEIKTMASANAARATTRTSEKSIKEDKLKVEAA